MVAGSFVAFMYWSLAVIVWVAIAFWPARVAGRKGHSFFLYFLFSLVFFPAALLVWEDVWATKLRDAVLNAGGELLDLERLPREVVQAAVEWAESN